MATAISPIFIPKPATDLAKITSVVPVAEKIGEVQAAENTLFTERIVLYEIAREQARLFRLLRLKAYANCFGVGTILLLTASLLCALAGIPYEPALACFFAAFGTFAVFWMKLRDANHQK